MDGQTRHAAIFASSQDQVLLFQYLPRGLSSGFRTVSISNIDLSAGDAFHHLGVVVYKDFLSVFVDGTLEHRGQLVAEVEDGGEAVTLVGSRAEGTSRFQGMEYYLGQVGTITDLHWSKLVFPRVRQLPHWVNLLYTVAAEEPLHGCVTSCVAVKGFYSTNCSMV